MKVLNAFNTLTLKAIFLMKLDETEYSDFEMNFFFQKTGVPFSVESTKIENGSLPYKASISETNVKTNRMVSTKWAYHKERSNYFTFYENFVSV